MLRKGNYLNDNVCMPKTRCTSSTQRAMYESVAAVDSTDFRTNGSDATCTLYSDCPSGYFQSFPGDDTHDVGCSKCPPGTHRNASLHPGKVACVECPAGTYSSVLGATSCLPCKNCLLASSTIAAGLSCPFASSECVRSARVACTPTNDAECMMCPTLSARGGYVLDFDGVCRACKDGYHYNASEPVVGRRCVPCTPNFYCPSKESYVQCEGMRIFRRGSGSSSGYVTVPTSPAGSVRPSQCNCSLAGGFEPPPSGSQGLGYGCQPCEDGYYAPPGETLRCLPCPTGTYSSQSRGLVDYYKCPSSDSPRISFLAVPSAAVAAVVPSCASSMVAGAASCTSCPVARPHTWAERSTSVDDCMRCPPGQFFDGTPGGVQSCRACRAACSKPYFYETVPCTDSGDRQCASCWLGGQGACDPSAGEYALPEGAGCPGPINAGWVVCLFCCTRVCMFFCFTVA